MHARAPTPFPHAAFIPRQRHLRALLKRGRTAPMCTPRALPRPARGARRPASWRPAPATWCQPAAAATRASFLRTHCAVCGLCVRLCLVAMCLECRCACVFVFLCGCSTPPARPAQPRWASSLTPPHSTCPPRRPRRAAPPGWGPRRNGSAAAAAARASVLQSWRNARVPVFCCVLCMCACGRVWAAGRCSERICARMHIKAREHAHAQTNTCK
jgi:hypothetical protein